MKRHLPHLLLMAAIVVLDQGTKALVVRSLPLHEYVPLVDGLLEPEPRAQSRRRLRHPVRLGPALPGAAALRCSASSPSSPSPTTSCGFPPPRGCPALALALVLGGAVGNLLDRLRLGYVVDFVHVYWRDHQWPDFNVADSAITVGVTLLVLDILRSPGPSPADAKPGIDAAAPTAGRID